MMESPDDVFDIIVSRLITRVQHLVDHNREPDDADIAYLAQLEAAIQGVERASKALLGYR